MNATDTATLATALRTAGHRLTSPRRAVWRVLAGNEGHLTAEQITREVQHADPGINVSSVYRTLGLLADIGLVRESNLVPGSASHWELAHADDQFHMTCNQCGTVQHHRGGLVQELRTHLGTHHGFEATGVELVVSGHCEDCAAK